MTTSPFRVLVVILSAAVCVLASRQPAEAQASLTFAYLQRAEDPRYDERKAYTGLVLRDRYPPIDGVRLALRESRVVGRSQGIRFELIEQTLTPEEDVVDVVMRLSRTSGVGVFLVDLPIDELRTAAAGLADQDMILFNLRHHDDALRHEACSPVLFHTLPSRSMLMDALAQYLRHKGWTKVLLLEGEAEADKALSTSFQGSAKKLGLTIVEVRRFLLTNDPRLRDQSNVPLLTGAADYDVIFLADTVGEYGRYVPYQSYLARPVVGSEGLTASAWHWTWERHGAPQLNQRFDRRAKRHMTETDWAGWAAVKSVVEASIRTHSTDVADLRSYLHAAEFTLDAYKGVPSSFRGWNNQLRQSILLHTHNAVIARAPLDGFLHQTNNLDTLGADRPDTSCSFQ